MKTLPTPAPTPASAPHSRFVTVQSPRSVATSGTAIRVTGVPRQRPESSHSRSYLRINLSVTCLPNVGVSWRSSALPGDLLSRAGLVALVVANLFVAFQTLRHEWGFYEVMLIYWTEVAILGFYNVLRMLIVGLV